MGDSFKDFKYCFYISSYYCEEFKNENDNMNLSFYFVNSQVFNKTKPETIQKEDAHEEEYIKGSLKNKRRKKVRAKKVIISVLIVMLFLLAISSLKLVDEYKLRSMVSYEENKYALYLKVKEHKFLSNEMIVYPENDVNRFFYVKKEKKDVYKDGYVYRLVEPLLYERMLGIQNQDFKNFKYAVMASNNNEGNLSVSDYDYKEQPDLENFLNKEKETLVTIKTFVNYGDKLNKPQVSNEIGDFVNKVMKNKFSNRDAKISFQFYLVTSKQYVKINPEKYKFKDKDEIIKAAAVKNVVFIECKGQKAYKDKVKIVDAKAK